MLPVTYTFCPQTVVAYTANVTVTELAEAVDVVVLVVLVVLVTVVVTAVVVAPVCNASAVRAATVALNTPPETVYAAPEQFDPLFGPVYTSQYVPSGSEVVNDDVQLESALLITTKPLEPRPNAICWLAGLTQLFNASVPTVL